MLTSLGTWIRMSWRSARSSASRSIRRLWTRISQCSQVAVPSPSGDFRAGTSSVLVGSGIGPDSATPVLSAISRTSSVMSSRSSGLVPARRTRACCILALVDAQHLAGRDGLAHVTDGEGAELRNLGGRLDAEGFLRTHGDDRGVARLDEVGVLLGDLAGGRVHLLVDGLDRTGDLCGVGVEYRRVTGRDHAGVLHDDDLGLERLGDRRRVVGGATDVAAADVVLTDAADVESDVVTGLGLGHLFVVHLDGLDFAAHVAGLEADVVAGVQETRLDTSDG